MTRVKNTYGANDREKHRGRTHESMFVECVQTSERIYTHKGQTETHTEQMRQRELLLYNNNIMEWCVLLHKHGI